MATYAQSLKAKRIQERAVLKANPLSDLVNSQNPEGLASLESPLSALVNQREALPLDRTPNRMDSPLSALVNQRPPSVLGEGPAHDPSPMARLVNRRK